MKGPPKNVAASVRDRLLKLAKESGEDFTYVLTRYALERLLVRLASSKYKDTFVLKGAMLFRLWSPKVHRPTKDLDLLGSGSPDRERVARVFAEIASVVVDDDGIVFDPKSVKASRIKEDAEYEGVRVNVTGRIGSARLELQIDVGFGDVVTPGTIDVDFPTLLPMTAPRLRAYPKETVVAEKLQAMVLLGIANSRMKDFFDVWFLGDELRVRGRIVRKLIAVLHAARR
jgi:predicted nucleotidyltransferase component of viral defense system